MIIKNLSREKTLAQTVRSCRNPWTRLKGLLGTKQLADSEACWIKPCRAVHTFGMKYPIDVYFLNRQGEVVSIQKNLKPNRLSPIQPGAHSVLEFASGERDCRVGDKLKFEGGQAVVETALMLIFFFVFLFAMVQVSHLFYCWFAVQHSVTEGARYAALGKREAADPDRVTSIRKKIQDMAASLDVPIPPADINFFEADGITPATGQANSYMLIVATFEYQPGFLALMGITLPIDLQGRTLIKNEPFTNEIFDITA